MSKVADREFKNRFPGMLPGTVSFYKDETNPLSLHLDREGNANVITRNQEQEGMRKPR
jgi:hypothetical protein